MRVKIKVEALPIHFLVLGGLLVAYTTVDLIISQFNIINAFLFLFGIVLLTSRQMLDINLSEKRYSEYYWVLGMTLSNYSEGYQEMLAVICTTGNYSQEYGKYNRWFISGIMYKGYIELKDQEKLFVGQSKSKQAMMKKITKIGAQLKIPVEDRSTKED